MSILQMSLMTDDEIEYTTDYIQIMNNIESDQPIAAQSKPHSNPDPRINSIFTSIQNAGIALSYVSMTTTEIFSQIARQSDDEALWQSVQVRSDKSMSDRQQDSEVKERISEIVHKYNLGEWGDFDNPPVGFWYNGKLWFLLGNGRIASIVGAAQEMGLELSFQVMLLDLESMFAQKQDLENWCAAIAKTGNSKTKNDVKPEENAEIINQVVDYWNRISDLSKQSQPNPLVLTQYFNGIEIYKNSKSKNIGMLKIREDVCKNWLKVKKNIYSTISQGQILSKAFDDQKPNTARIYDPGGTFGELIPKIWKKHVDDACCFSNTSSGFHRNTHDLTGKQCYFITKTLGRCDNILLRLYQNMMGAEDLEITVIIDPYTDKMTSQRSSHTRQSNVISILNRIREEINTASTIMNGKGGTVKRVVVPRVMDSSGVDKNGNLDCDIIYYWNNQCWVRIDDGQFGREEKLKTKLFDPNETEDDSVDS